MKTHTRHRYMPLRACGGMAHRHPQALGPAVQRLSQHTRDFLLPSRVMFLSDNLKNPPLVLSRHWTQPLTPAALDTVRDAVARGRIVLIPVTWCDTHADHQLLISVQRGSATPLQIHVDIIDTADTDTETAVADAVRNWFPRHDVHVLHVCQLVLGADSNLQAAEAADSGFCVAWMFFFLLAVFCDTTECHEMVHANTCSPAVRRRAALAIYARAYGPMARASPAARASSIRKFWNDVTMAL